MQLYRAIFKSFFMLTCMYRFDFNFHSYVIVLEITKKGTVTRSWTALVRVYMSSFGKIVPNESLFAYFLVRAHELRIEEGCVVLVTTTRQSWVVVVGFF